MTWTGSRDALAARHEMTTPDTLPRFSNIEPVTLGADVTIGISAYGNYETTQLCLQMLFRSARGEYELILVDDCSPDNGRTRDLFLGARQQHARTRVFSFTKNLEYSGSLNAILSHASGQSVLFLSNDIFVTPFYLTVLLDVIRSNPRFGIVRGSSNFVDNNGRPTHNIAIERPIGSGEELAAAAGKVFADFGHKTSIDEFLTGDAFMVSRALLDRIGTFDPLFFGYFADHDFGLRAQIAGFDLVVAPGAFAYHRSAANFDYLPKEQQEGKLGRRFMRIFENWARFKMKYGLPVEMLYEGTDLIPWKALAAGPFDARKHYSAAADYSEYAI
jgi:GT2 family glycosyltransferase